MEGTLWGEPPLTDIGYRHDFSARGLAPVTGAQKKSDKGFWGKNLSKLPKRIQICGGAATARGPQKEGFLKDDGRRPVRRQVSCAEC